MTNDVLYGEFSREVSRTISPEKPKQAQLGYVIDGEYQVKVKIGTNPDGSIKYDENKYWVRFEDKSYKSLEHRGNVAPKEDLYVLVKTDEYGKEYISGTDPEFREKFSGSSGESYEVGYHHHKYGSQMSYPIHMRLLEQFRAQPYSGTKIYVSPGPYDGGKYWWPGGYLDLSSEIPTDPNKQRLVIISIDKTTTPHSLIATSGDDYPTTIALSLMKISDISTPSNSTRIDGVKVRTGKTSFVESDFFPLGWGGSEDSSIHNSLSGIQGGITNEYYHLKNTSYVYVEDIQGLVKYSGLSVMVGGIAETANNVSLHAGRTASLTAIANSEMEVAYFTAKGDPVTSERTGLRVSVRHTQSDASNHNYAMATRLSHAKDYSASDADQGLAWFEFGNDNNSSLDDQFFSWGINGHNGTPGTELMRLDSDGVLYVNAISPGTPGCRNLLLDPEFRFWPEGTSGSPADATYTYTSVMMGVYRGAAGGSSTCTWQRVNFSVGAVDNPPGEPEFYMQLAGNLSGGTAANQQWFADFPVEDVRTASNGDVTFSIWLHGSSAGTIAVQPIQLFGSGGSSAVYVTGQEIDVTTTWTRYTLTFSIPSMNGKTIGTASSLRLRIYKQAGSTIQAAVNLPNAINFTGNLNMWAAQLERGSIMTDFERRPISLEQRLIERYFQMWTAITTEYLATGMCVTTQQAWFPIQLKTPLRSAPTMSINNLHVFDVSNNWTVVAMDATLIGTDTVAIRLIIGTASFGVTRPAIIRMPSSGSFVKADARL